MRRLLARPTPPPPVQSETRIGPFEQKMSRQDMQRALAILGCTGADLGSANSLARRALSKFLADNQRPSSDRITNEVFFTLRELSVEGRKGPCSG